MPALLAGRSLADVGAFNPNNPAHLRVQDALIETMQDRDPHTGKPASTGGVPLRRRAEAADALDELGWLPPDLHVFIRIDAEALERHGLVAPPGVELPFYIAKYPVANLQYAHFLAAEDYADPHLWTGFPRFDEDSQPMREDWGDAGWDWLQSALQDKDYSLDGRCVLPRYWNDPRFGIARRGVPVVGITWYEASAYCRWLLRHWSELDEGRDNPGWRPRDVCLLLEAEWALAAGGDQDENRYPWDPPGQITRDVSEIVRRANVSESRIGRTTPLGMYPLGASWPFGLWDLAGNVWEWQANFYDKDHHFLSLRGGSWDLVHRSARPAFRDSYRPVNLWFSLGFRVVAAPS